VNLATALRSLCLSVNHRGGFPRSSATKTQPGTAQGTAAHCGRCPNPSTQIPKPSGTTGSAGSSTNTPRSHAGPSFRLPQRAMRATTSTRLARSPALARQPHYLALLAQTLISGGHGNPAGPGYRAGLHPRHRSVEAIAAAVGGRDIGAPDAGRQHQPGTSPACRRSPPRTRRKIATSPGTRTRFGARVERMGNPPPIARFGGIPPLHGKGRGLELAVRLRAPSHLRLGRSGRRDRGGRRRWRLVPVADSELAQDVGDLDAGRLGADER